MMRLSSILLGVCVLVAGLRCTPPPAPPTLTVEDLALPSAAGSSASFLTTGPDGTVYASWVDRLDGDSAALRMASLPPGDSGWSAPRTIAAETTWFVNWADTPSLAVHPDGTMLAHWLEKNGMGTYAYGVRVARSTDGGATWSAPLWLHEDQSAAEHGFATLHPLPDGQFMTAWLDGRKFGDGVHEMTVRARLVHADGSLAPEMLLDDLSCECCPVSGTVLPNGEVVVAYRDRTPEEVRDIYVARYDGSEWQSPVQVHADGWVIAGCPVNGPALASTASDLAIAWFTAPGEAPQMHFAVSNDGGTTFGTPTRFDEGSPIGRVAMLADEDGFWVLWMEATGSPGAADLLLRRISADGTLEAPMVVARLASSRGSGIPRMARAGDTMIVSWTSTEPEPHVVTARVSAATP